MTKLDSSAEADVVGDDRGGTDGKWFRIGDVEFVELDPALPNFSQEILEDLDRELLAGTAAIAEAERRKARIVTDRQGLAVDDTKDGPKAAIVDSGFASVLDLEGVAVEGTFGKADLLALGFVYLLARRQRRCSDPGRSSSGPSNARDRSSSPRAG